MDNAITSLNVGTIKKMKDKIIFDILKEQGKSNAHVTKILQRMTTIIEELATRVILLENKNGT